MNWKSCPTGVKLTDSEDPSRAKQLEHVNGNELEEDGLPDFICGDGRRLGESRRTGRRGSVVAGRRLASGC